MRQDPLTWSVPEYEEKERGIDWYWAVGIIALAAAVVSVIYKNYLFAVLVIIGAFTLLLFAARKPREIECEIKKSGVRIGTILYPFPTLKSFCVHPRKETRRARLVIQSTKLFAPYIVLPLPDEMPEDTIHALMLEYLIEEEHPESLSEILLERLGF